MANTGAVRPTTLHRVFLQSFLARRCMTDEVLLHMYKRALSACQEGDPDFRATHAGDKNGMRTFIAEVNRLLESQGMQMEIKSVLDEAEKGREVFAMVNLDNTDEAIHMSDYEPLQIAFFRKVVNMIIESHPANSIGSNQALGLTSTLTGTMTKSQADLLLESFVSRGWLAKSSRGRYSLAPRAILELRPWFTAEYEDLIKSCARCKKVVFTVSCPSVTELCSAKLISKGIICENRLPDNQLCKAHVHKSCYNTLHSLPQPRCPKCNNRFLERPAQLGEKAVSRDKDKSKDVSSKRKRGSNTANGARKGRSSGAGDDEDEEEEEEDDELDDDFEEEEGAEAGPSRRRTSRADVEVTDDEEVEETDTRRRGENSSGVMTGNGPTGWKVAGRSSRNTQVMVPDSQPVDGDEEDEEPAPRRGGPTRRSR